MSRWTVFVQSPFIADVKLWGGTAALCALISLDYTPR